MIEVIEVRKSLDDFIAFPLILYAKDPLFVPQLNKQMREHFSEKNPFFAHSDVRYLLAVRDGRVCGRVAAFVNRNHNDFHHDRTGFFGFFECVNDPAAAGALFDGAARYLTAKGMETMRGPMNFSTNEECGFLLEGFDESPRIMMPYNPPYYNELASGYGMEKIKDLFAYIYEVQDDLPEKVRRVAAIAEKRGITARPLDMKKFDSEMRIFKDVYHSAWEDNWGFVPMTEGELEYMASMLKQIIIPDMVVIAEKDGVPVGFMGLVPDFNSVLIHMKGKLNPLSIVKALYYSRKITDLRVMLLGIKREFRNKGVEALLYREGWGPIKRGIYRRVEFSWILEDNIPVQRTIEIFGGRIYKKYRIYEKRL
jgi:hypothetical protein